MRQPEAGCCYFACRKSDSGDPVGPPQCLLWVRLGPQPMFAARPLRPAKADISGLPSDVAAESLFDHLVCARKHVRWYIEAKRLGGLEIDHSLEPGRLLHGQVGRPFALKDAVDIASGEAIRL